MTEFEHIERRVYDKFHDYCDRYPDMTDDQKAMLLLMLKEEEQLAYEISKATRCI